MINELIKLADHFDSIGLTKEATFLDIIIKKSAEDSEGNKRDPEEEERAFNESLLSKEEKIFAEEEKRSGAEGYIYVIREGIFYDQVKVNIKLKIDGRGYVVTGLMLDPNSDNEDVMHMAKWLKKKNRNKQQFSQYPGFSEAFARILKMKVKPPKGMPSPSAEDLDNGNVYMSYHK